MTNEEKQELQQKKLTEFQQRLVQFDKARTTNVVAAFLRNNGKEQSKSPEDIRLGIKLMFEELLELIAASGQDVRQQVDNKGRVQYDMIKDFTKELMALRTSSHPKIELEEEYNEAAVFDALIDSEVVLHNVVYYTGLTNRFRKGFSIVMASNFSKKVQSLDEAELTVEKYKNQGLEVSVTPEGTVQRTDGKIMKSALYIEADELLKILLAMDTFTINGRLASDEEE